MPIRVPQVEATQGLATARVSTAGAAQLDPGTFGGLVGAGARSFSRVAETFGDLAEASARLEQKKQQIAAAHQAARLTTEYAVAAEDIISLHERAPDPANHATNVETALAKLRQKMSGQINDPDVLDHFTTSSETILRDRALQARRYGDKLFIDDSNASRALTIRDNLRLAAEADDPTVQQRHLGLAAGLIKLDMQAGVISKVEGAKELVKLQEDFQESVALRLGRHDPLGAARALESGEGFKALTVEKRLQLAEHFTKQYIQRRESFTKDLEDRLKKEEAALVTDFDRRVRDATTAQEKAGILQELDTRADMRQIDRPNYDRIRDAIERPKDKPSDPTVYSAIGLDVHGSNPKTTERQIDQLVSTGQLNIKDGLAFKDRLRSQHEFLTTKATTEAGRTHSQAEQILFTGLTTRSPFEALDPISQKVKLLALEELTKRSNAFGGQENPLTIAYDILPRYQQVLIGQNLLAVENLRKLLNYPTPQDLEAAYQTKRVNRGVYESQKKIFVDLYRAQQDAEAIQQQRDALKASGAPVMGRGAKTPVEIGVQK